MKAGVVIPGQEASARLIDTDMPVISSGQALARLLQLGIDGTDIEIDRGKYGEAPPDEEFLSANPSNIPTPDNIKTVIELV